MLTNKHILLFDPVDVKNHFDFFKKNWTLLEIAD